MNAFTDNFAYIGTRATKGSGGRYWIAGPQWSGRAPDGVTVIQSSTNDNWMLMRTLVDGEADLAAASAFQKQLTVATPPGTAVPRPFTTRAADVYDPRTFLGVVNEMLSRSPGGKGHTAKARRFAPFGIGATVSPAPPRSVDAGDCQRPGLPARRVPVSRSRRRRDGAISPAASAISATTIDSGPSSLSAGWPRSVKRKRCTSTRTSMPRANR